MMCFSGNTNFIPHTNYVSYNRINLWQYDTLMQPSSSARWKNIIYIYSNPGQGQKFGSRFLFHVCPSSQLSYDEYTDRTLSVGRSDG